MKKLLITVIIAFSLFSFGTYQQSFFADATLDESVPVTTLLESFGEDFSEKKPQVDDLATAASIGKDIVINGFSNQEGQPKSRRQSKHFVCISCHNIEREDPDLTSNDPQARLEYVVSKDLPFLQGTTLYGAINRTSYYNGDYDQKYGELVKPARHDIREAIQLCAQECAQGRELKDWELESVLAYIWTLGYKVEDLGLSQIEKESIETALDNPVLKNEALRLIKRKYLPYSEATFIKPPENRKAGTGLPGNPKNGKLIYENSCLHCHYQGRYSFLYLDNDKMSFSFLQKNADTYSRHSIYQVIRWGTYSKFLKQSYMPNYTEEKMSDQQLADLRAYIAEQAL